MPLMLAESMAAEVRRLAGIFSQFGRLGLSGAAAVDTYEWYSRADCRLAGAERVSNEARYTSYLASGSERRVHARRPMNGLAYVDIGSGNGGIVLNLSEGGLGFRAVGPLDRTGEVQFSIQLPSCPERIEATAQVMWLGTSNRQAGAKFLNIAGEGKARIEEWIRSQEVLAGTWSETPPKPRKPVSEIRPRRDVAREPEAPETQVESADISPGAYGSSALLAELSKGSVTDSTAASEHIEEHADLALAEQTYGEPPSEEGAPPDAEAPVREAASNGESEEHAAPLLAESNLGAPLTHTTTLPNDAPVFTSITDSVQATARSVGLPPVAVVAGFLLVFAALCFAIGTWVGSPRRASQPTAQLTRPEVTPSPAETAPIVPDDAPSTPARPNSTANKSHVRQTAAKTPETILGDDAAAPTESSAPDGVNSSSVTASSPAEQPSAAATAAPPPVAPQSAPLAAVTAPPTPPAAVAQNATPTVAPGPAADAPVPVTSRVVDGITVKSTDRFIPSRLTYRVEPDYPAQARQQLVEGTVRIHQVIGPDGTVRSVKLLNGSILLAPAALEASRYWQYFPALLNGEAVQSEKDIEIDFRIPR
jgi:TonB family protein